ncbi:MAG: 7-cyano-7-deazaguanine synthase QueC [Calditrichaeota bacterium]|nr:MAG: 7-cyano-7-deazaguanine synthase QueC [Calditrichota bacterium]
MSKKAIILLSGGIDSTTALYHSQENYEIVKAVSFDYGSKHNAKEIDFAQHHAEALNIPHALIELPFINELFKSHLLQSGGDIPDGHYQEKIMKQTVVPFRNGIMLSIAGGLAESENATKLIIAAHTGDHAIYPDCRTDFMQAMSQALKLGTYTKTEIIRPFIDQDKTAIVKIGTKVGIDYSKTWSCYKGLEKHCGSCGTCIERREAFLNAGITDPTEYIATGPIPDKPNE